MIATKPAPAAPLMELLADREFAVEVLCGPVPALGDGTAREWLTAQGFVVQAVTGEGEGAQAGMPHLRTVIRSVPVSMPRGTDSGTRGGEGGDRTEFPRLLDDVLARFRPDVVMVRGDGRFAGGVLGRAKALGAATVAFLPGFADAVAAPLHAADAVIVPSRFAADYHLEASGLRCEVLPDPVDPARVVAGRANPEFVTFVDPTPANGVYAFARIADELGRRRPDIPFLVVEGRGTEATVAACGLDLRRHGNVHFHPPTPDPRDYWARTRLALAPALGWEAPAAVAEALLNGIPVVGADRGGLPEAIGDGGLSLSLPDRLTVATTTLPTADEVTPWVEAIIRLWDDRDRAADLRRKALAHSQRWSPGELAPRYARLLAELRPAARPPVSIPPGRAGAVVLVPHHNGIDAECEVGLRQLERAGVRVVRVGGCSQIDVARNDLASGALHDGAGAILFIDSDIGFDPADALRLLARPEPVISGVYAKKGRRELASEFAEGVAEVAFGPGPGPYPLIYAATGFLRIRAEVLRRMIDELQLPLCNTRWGRGFWPFFGPIVVPHPEGGSHYLGEDWAFSHRVGLIGVTPLADTTIRLWHYGRHPHGWEDAGGIAARFPSFLYKLRSPGHASSAAGSYRREAALS